MSLPQPVFSRAEAIANGVSARRLRASDLRRPFRGIRSTAESETLEQRCREYLPRLRDDQFFSRVTAARLYGIPLPRALETRDELDVTGRQSRPRTTGVIGHRAVATPVAFVRGLPVTDATWLLPELSGILALDDLIVAGDALVRRKLPPASLDQLLAVANSSNARAIRAVRRALQDVRPGTDSPMETRVRLLIVRAGLPEPVIGNTIYDSVGGFIGTPDLSYPAPRIAIEYEGSQHRDNPRVFAEDIERRELMQEAGWYVIRVIADHVFRSPLWLTNRIGRVLAQRDG